MKFLVIGCNGMAGSIISLYLKEQGHSVLGLDLKPSQYVNSEVCDVTNFALLDSFIDGKEYDCIINCVGILNKAVDSNVELGILLNSVLPHHLNKVAQRNNSYFIHMSTDCVFSGEDGEYNETSTPDSKTLYGKSKALGEINNESSLTLRTSIVGPDTNPKGIGLFNWFMAQHGEINGFTKAIWTGVTTLELAKVMEKCAKERPTGLINIVNNQDISKYELLKLFKQEMKKEDVAINEYDGFNENKSLRRTRLDFDYIVPSYAEMIKEMAIWIENHKEMYPHYMEEK